MTVHELVARGWFPPYEGERILSLTQVRDKVIIVTDSCIFRAQSASINDFVVYLVSKH
jgi:hypothetical protein